MTLSRNAKIALAAILVIVTLLLLLVTELFARAYLRGNEMPTYSLLWHSQERANAKETIVDRRLSQGLNMLDPQLGYARPPGGDRSDPAWRWPGFKTLGDERGGALRIVVLGGSTSDPYYEDEWGSWSAVLYEKFRANGVSAVIYNGAVSGYSTNQELLKLVRDVEALSPDIVISLSGVNDLGFAHSLRNYPMVSPYQLTTLEAITGKAARPAPFMPNLVAAFSAGKVRQSSFSITTGVAVQIADVKMWRRNVEMMQVVSAHLGAEFYVFLQPALGVDTAYTPAPAETALYQTLLDRQENYEAMARGFYASARRVCSELSYCTDISEIFSGKTGMYYDPRHPNKQGNQLIGETVFETLAKIHN